MYDFILKIRHLTIGHAGVRSLSNSSMQSPHNFHEGKFNSMEELDAYETMWHERIFTECYSTIHSRVRRYIIYVFYLLCHSFGSHSSISTVLFILSSMAEYTVNTPEVIDIIFNSNWCYFV